MLHQMRRDAETQLATALSACGVKKKRSRRRQGSAAVEKTLAKLLVPGQPVSFETIAQLLGRAAKPKPDDATATPAAELPDAPPF